MGEAEKRINSSNTNNPSKQYQSNQEIYKIKHFNNKSQSIRYKTPKKPFYSLSKRLNLTKAQKSTPSTKMNTKNNNLQQPSLKHCSTLYIDRKHQIKVLLQEKY